METNTPPVPPPLQNIPPTSTAAGRTEGIWSIVCAVISLAFFPPLFGLIGIYLGYRSRKKGQHSLGTVGLTLSIVCMVLGMIIGGLVNTWLQNHK